MKKQDYSNHVRYYAPHHFILYPLLFVFLLISVYHVYLNPEDGQWKLIVVIIILISWFSFMVRQHYALVLQNRIVRLELRLRYFQLTGERMEKYEQELTFKQLAALRFASDEELPALVQ